MKARLGLIGLGKMGGRMAPRLISGGYDLIVHDPSSDAVRDVVARGARKAATAAEIGDEADIVLVSLPTPAIVQEVAAVIAGGRRVRTYVDLSTTGSQTARHVAKSLAARGIAALDAPVSGGTSGAEAGTLSIMVSGPRSALEAASPILSLIGSRIFDLGIEPGAAQLAKSVNQVVYFCTLAATMEAIAVAQRGGLDPNAMIEVINASSGRSWASENRFLQAVLPGKNAGAFIGSAAKDLGLAVSEAKALGLTPPFAVETASFWGKAAAKLGAQEDIARAIRLFDEERESAG